MRVTLRVRNLTGKRGIAGAMPYSTQLGRGQFNVSGPEAQVDARGRAPARAVQAEDPGIGPVVIVAAAVEGALKNARPERRYDTYPYDLCGF